MATTDDVAAQIITSLRLTDPELDTSVGTTTRKIIDAVAESVGEAYVDRYMLSYTYDIDAKAEGDLDAFCRLFGISRFAPKRATGTVVFTRTGSTAAALTIPYNVSLRSPGEVPQDFITVAPAVFAIGAANASAPIQAVNAGIVGNVGPGTITVGGNNLPANVSVTNVIPTTGGTEAETDDELRLRWKRTVFRSLAGTEQMYLGIALDNEHVLKANIVSGTKNRLEQVQVASGSATSQVPDAQFVFASGVTFGVDIEGGDVFLRGTDYTWTTSTPPVITVLNATKIPDATVAQLSFQYTSEASRNDPSTGVMHRVDVWVSGVDAVQAVQSVIFSSAITFNTTGGSPYNRANFIRNDGTLPTSGNVFIPLAYGPIIIVPESLSIDGHSYGLVGSGAVVDHSNAYRIVHDDTAEGYSPVSLYGLEWDSTMLPSTVPFSIGADGDYTYNDVPRLVQTEIDRWRLLGIDVLVHQAKTSYLRVSLAIIYTGSIAVGTVDDNIENALSTFFAGVGFDSAVQYSDILQVVHNVAGVDAVRFLHGDDYLTWNPATPNAFDVGIQKIVDGVVVHSYVDTNGRPLDVIFGDDEVAAFESMHRAIRAQNTFGVA